MNTVRRDLEFGSLGRSLYKEYKDGKGEPEVNRTCLCFLAVAALSCPARAQKVELRKPDREQIIHVETSLNHLTVLEMSEPVITVAVGSSSFKVEWRENKVFIEPNDANVATNLFVWTASGRFNYELDPAGSVPQMDFAIDQPAVDPPPAPVKTTVKPAGPSPADVLLQAKPIRLYGSVPEKNHAALYLTDVLEHDGQIVIRYTIRNQTRKPYLPGAAQVTTVNAPRFRQSLYSFADCQLGMDAASHLKSSGMTTVQVTSQQMQSSLIEPGQQASGIITILAPAQKTPTVLRFWFLADANGPVTATLVL